MKNVEDIYPCTPLQQGLLFHTLSTPGSGIYVNQCSCRLDGDLDVGSFRRAWQLVVERHAVLRTAFVWEEVDTPLQVVRRRVRQPWYEEDWRGTDQGAQAERLDRHLDDERRRGFDPERAPLFRLGLLHLADDDHRFVWTFHHLLLDGWSTALLLRELLEIYHALRRGAAYDRPAPPPYRHYIAWLMQQDVKQAEDFWRRELAGFTNPVRLGIEGDVNSGGERPAFLQARMRLPAMATGALQALARRQRLTLNTLVQGVWALLIARYSGADDVVYGTVVSGRPVDVPQIESMIGLFINTQPVRVEVPAGELALPWLERLQARLVALRQFEHTPLAQIRRWSEIPSEAFLFESILAFENYPGGLESPGGETGLAVRDLRQLEATDQPLTVSAEATDELLIRIAFEARRFPQLMVVRLLGHLETLLRGLGADADRSLHALPLLSASERHAVLCEWNDTTAGDGAITVPALFASAAGRSPAAVAITADSTALTYGELEARSNRLARYLYAQGIGPETRVAVYLERSPELVVALLAILKAGGAYVPLSPGYPEQRLRFMLADSKAALVITESGLAGTILAAGRLVLLDREQAEIAAQSGSPFDASVGPEALAYVMYTSGSTGWPKGVAITHRGIVRLVRQSSFAELGPAQVFLLLAPTAFDASTLEIWGPLLNGGRLAVAPPGNLSPQGLEEQIDRAGVNTLWLTAELFHLMLDEQPAALQGVRQLLAGGDVLSPSHVRRALAELPGIEVINGYGPTENTTFTCCHRLRNAAAVEAPVPIGRPIANSTAHVLDRELRPVPIGVVGELYAGGWGLARGYFGRPDLTAERFVPDPMSGLWGEPGGRLYRTGDRAKYLPDGKLHFRGRADRQVKLHGVRIELAELEAALERHPAVRRAAAVLREEPPGRCLVAYAALDRDHRAGRVGEDELRAFLQATLPPAMVPAAVVLLEDLPLTPSGKLDRRALPAPEQAAARASTGGAARTPAEAQLAAVWAEVLRIERVGVHDDFFALGGDSILAIQITSRSCRLGLRLSPQQIFEHPTVAELAAVVGTAPSAPAEQGPVTGPVPLTPIQRWFFERDLPRPEHFNQAVLLALDERFPQSALPLALSTLVAHHDALRLRFVRTAQGWEQSLAEAGGEPPFTCIDLSALAAAAQSSAAGAAMAALQASLDLADGRLARVALFKMGGRVPDRLLWIIHHLAVDGVSWRILLDDLRSISAGLRSGRGIELPPKAASFKQWAQRLVEYGESESVRAELEHWLAAAGRNVARLPMDGPVDRQTALAAPARAITAALSLDETRALLQEVPAAFRTQINDALLAALAMAVRRWTGEDRLLVDVEGHGREDLVVDLDLSRTVGWFTTIYPVLLDLEGAADAGDAILTVKRHLRAIPRRGIGYGLLRFGGDPAVARALAAVPGSEVGFNYLGQLDAGEGGESLFRLAFEGTGPQVSVPTRTYLLEIAAAVVGGCLRVEWTYGEGVHERATVEALATGFLDALRSITVHGRRPAAASVTLADFPSARLDLEELGALASLLDGTNPA